MQSKKKRKGYFLRLVWDFETVELKTNKNLLRIQMKKTETI